MNVVLVRPKFPEEGLHTYPPFGLITIAPYFASTVKVEVCDTQDKGIFESAVSKNPDVIAFSCFSSQLSITKNLIEHAKNNCKSRIVVGGSGTTSNPQYAREILGSGVVLVAGDGEYFAEELPLDTGIYRSKMYDFKNHRIPAWNLINYKKYRALTGFAVETSRGCPFNCVWCTAHLVSGKKWRGRKPADVVSEIRFLKEQYKCKMFYFPDDNCTADPKRWVELMQELTNANLGISLHVPEGIQAHHLDYDTLLLMKKAGFKLITIGAESGCQRVLDKVIDKGGLKVEQIENVVRTSKQIGLDVNCFFVIGTVGETLEEAEQTVEFAEHLRSLGAYSCMVRNAIPIPGTRMFDIAVEKGYLTVPKEKLSDLNFVHSGRHFLSTPEWTPEQIESLVERAKREDAQHILLHKKGHIFKKGIVRLFRDPKSAYRRLKQLYRESK